MQVEDSALSWARVYAGKGLARNGVQWEVSGAKMSTDLRSPARQGHQRQKTTLLFFLTYI